MKKTKIMLMLLVCGLVAVSAAIPQSQPTISAPSSEQAKTTCLALEHLVVLARSDNKAEDALALAKSYMLVRKYVTDSSLHDADAYVQYFLDHYGTRLSVANGPGNNFVNFSGDVLGGIRSDLRHQSGVIVYDKSGVLENLHLVIDSNAVDKALKDKGAVPAENH